MEININDNTKTAEFWLTRNESDNPDFRKNIKPLCKEFSSKKYFVAIFMSGDKELFEQTSNLLCYNKKRIAQLEVERDKQIQS